jgi:G:T/U-mismatch repair DNA glycosylase
MPVGEIEEHPYLQRGQTPNASRLILGSFPVYECTNPESELKAARRNEGTVRFFYGSSRNRLWRLYAEYIDQQILPPWDGNRIIESLSMRNIAISDTIQSCERINFSSEDTALRNQVWNVNQIRTLIENGVRKILCTSKGVLDTLDSQIINVGGFGTSSHDQTEEFQTNFIGGIHGAVNQIRNPCCRCFLVQGRIIQALAIPSPGSPQRRLSHFGFPGGNSMEYAALYFQNAFEWLVH